MQRDDRRVRLWTRNGQPGGLRLFTLSATGCSGAKLLVLMTTLAEIKQWRLTLTPDTAAADEPAGHRAEKLLASDRRSPERDNPSAPLDLGSILSFQ